MAECMKKIDWFCYTCGKYTVPKHRRTMTDLFKHWYKYYFSLTVIEQNWVPKICCQTCYTNLVRYSKRQIDAMPFGRPMIWMRPKPHTAENCFVCQNYVFGASRNKKYDVKPASSVILPVPHSADLRPPPLPPMPENGKNYENVIDEIECVATSSNENVATSSSGNVATRSKNSDDFDYVPSVAVHSGPIMYSQSHLDAVVRSLKLSQRNAEILAADLKLHNILGDGVRVTGYRHRQAEFLQYFQNNDANDFVFCINVEGLVEEMGIDEYNAEEWRFFIDSSKSSLKAVLLFHDNSKPSIPLAYATKMDESYESVKLILDSIGYNQHKWRFCSDYKLIAIVSGIQQGWVSKPCFICVWDSRFRGNHYSIKTWDPREEHVIGEQNIVNERLIPAEKILLPPLHIKLGLMSSFVRNIINNEAAISYLKTIFDLSDAKINAGSFPFCLS